MAFSFIFPGQGSQKLKMMDGLIGLSAVQDIFLQANDELKVDFLKMLQEDSPDNINKTINTQPLMLMAGYATYVAWISMGGKKPSIIAGHSLGEWTALVASGVIEFSEALRLVKIRAQLMQEAVSPENGAMAAVLGLSDDKVVEICEEVQKITGQVVEGVNFNSPGQVVIAGDRKAVENACVSLKEHGAKKTQLLPVSVPAHCKLMNSAGEKLALELLNVKFNPPQIEILHNYNTESYTDTNQIKDAVIRQLYSPVQWNSTIQKIEKKGVLDIVECGPGKVLTGLNKRISENIRSRVLHNQEDFDNALIELN